jgi:hypothetical protein
MEESVSADSAELAAFTQSATRSMEKLWDTPTAAVTAERDDFCSAATQQTLVRARRLNGAFGYGLRQSIRYAISRATIDVQRGLIARGPALPR